MQSAFTRLAVSRFVKVLAVIGISYQVFSQTWEYFLYPSYSSIAQVPVNTRLPAITLCASFWEGSKDKYYNSLPVYNASVLMPSYHEVINYCYLTLPNSTVVDCTSISKPHKYMSHKMTCYSLFEKDRTYLPDDQLMYSQAVRLKNNIETPFLRMKFNTPWNDSDHYSITLRGAGKPIKLIRSTESKVWLEPKVNEEVVLNYKITRRVELPPPYGSCRNYPPPFDADSAMIECWYNKFYTDSSKTGRYWPQWVFFDYEKNYTQEELFRMRPKNEAAFAAVNNECMKYNRRVDCDRSYVIVDKIASLKTDVPGKFLITEIPWVPASQIYITNHIKTPLFEYFNQIGGILSMWVAFSIYVSCVEFTSFIGSCIQRRIARRKSTSQLMSTFTSSDLKGTGNPCKQETLAHRLNNLAMRLLSWLATLYFVVEIIMIYFERPFNTCIIAEIPVTINMLQVSVCFNMVIHPEKVKKLYPHLYDTVPSDKWRERFTIEQLFKTTTEWHEVYKPSSTYLSPNGSYVKIHEHFNFTKSITGKYTCFTTLGEREYLLPGVVKEHLRASVSFATNMFLRLNTSQLHKLNQSRFRVYLHQDGIVREDHSAPDRFLVVGNRDARLYPNNHVIRTYRTVRKLYPDHMMSTCWNYKDKFGHNREIMFNKCISKRFIHKYRIWPSGYQVWQRARHHADMKMDSLDVSDLNISNHSMQEKFNMIRDQCDAILHRPECEQLFVKVRVEDVFFRKTGLTAVVLYPPSKQFLVYEQQLIYTIVDILGYIGGTINAWIGLSFLDFQVALCFIVHCLRRSLLSNTVYVNRSHFNDATHSNASQEARG